ncbi:MAG: hypothetical protein US60_C0002G0011 [Microgenomates group bacterium GW2011_GWC1_37_8]|uniref:Uncharacterized protein n=2 Tax=Candidatus Woeseibacteriota TaxID=1752722 RepID=A0A0G0NHR4_9BACT|nr:MAG: hypothetical protein US60_C0002G0011 [Microgenomates group bacterium GW2011_GWC1_37_8]KKQ85449.1 MAG: hypothetical protein UT08_C0006G0032 [Candidatus Woesebacteria bacterium GW2011_GWB1_38_8]OGM21133.1 MAG: hypothetical protein A2863_03450 [Candidatus Woesebacteria bacterium RIFCSPHIGHO2_01_FULL_38_9b]
MASLTQTSVVARRVIRYSIYAIILILIGRLIFRGVVTLYRRVFPEPPPKATLGFGKLPKLPFPEKNRDKKFNYILELPDVSLPKLPEQEAVYYMPPFETNIGVEDDAKNKARSMGYNQDGKVIVEGVPNVYIFQKNNVPSTLTMNIITGIFSVSYNLDADPSVLVGNPPETGLASRKAAGFLSRAGALKDDLKKGIYTYQYLKQSGGIFQSVSSLSEADSIKVNLFRQNYGIDNNVPSVTPDMPEANIWFVIGAGRGNEIIAAEYNYYPLDAGKKETYTIITSDKAFEKLKNGEGYIANVGENTGTNIIIRRVYLGYYDPGQYTKNYQPVVVFEGDNNFYAFVPAISEEYYGNEDSN